MSPRPLSYAIVTPARNETTNLSRLAACLAAQTRPPETWVVVDNGSTDETPAVVDELAGSTPWLRSLRVESAELARGGPVTRAFQAGLALVDPLPDVVVKLDADVSFQEDYFERLVEAFRADERLGIASGSCYERDPDGVWRQQFGTGDTVWGAARAYRAACLSDVLPLDENIGWDGIDVLKASHHGWRTQTLLDLPFRHHRVEGERDGRRRTAWAARGRSAHYMGYRLSYMLFRTLYQVRRDPAAAYLLAGYASAAATRAPRCQDEIVRDLLRGEQRLRNLFRRRREVRGERTEPRYG
jgi:glycosyltransferase involved in cell wall biosynthesis